MPNAKRPHSFECGLLNLIRRRPTLPVRGDAEDEGVPDRHSGKSRNVLHCVVPTEEIALLRAPVSRLESVHLTTAREISSAMIPVSGSGPVLRIGVLGEGVRVWAFGEGAACEGASFDPAAIASAIT